MGRRRDATNSDVANSGTQMHGMEYLTVMQMVKSSEIEGVLRVLRVLRMMQATGHVNADTLQA